MTRRATSALLIQKIETNLTTNQKALVLFNTLPSLIVGGSITKFSIFFRPLQFISTPPQFTEILEISTPSHLLPNPQIN